MIKKFNLLFADNTIDFTKLTEAELTEKKMIFFLH